MNVQRLAPRDYLRQPWKNGGGFASELATEREGGCSLWRLSIAEIDRSGPFSDYSGHERTIMLLEGDGMELAFDGGGTARLDRVHEPFAFDGGWKIHCRLLGGPVKALNLFAIARRAASSMSVLAPGEARTLEIDAPWLSLYCLSGAAGVDLAGHQHVVDAGGLLRVDDAIGNVLDVRGVASPALLAVIRVHPRLSFPCPIPRAP